MDHDFRYGQLAIEGQLISPDQFDEAMAAIEGSKNSLKDYLVKRDIIDSTTAERLDKALMRIMRDERMKSEDGVLAQKQIGGYKLLRRIGEGGMGEVYVAEQLNMHRRVALKVLHDKWAQDEEFRKRFLLEARSAGRLSHQNLVQVYDVGKYLGMYYFSMEFIDGVTVEDLIDEQGTMDIKKTIDIAIQVCMAIDYLADNDIVHRDIKPGNIMLTKEDTVKLGDLGFIQSIHDAELMQEGTTLGTPDYISPEQARGERNLDVRTDIYSLGATLFHMLSGKTMFQGSGSEVLRDHIDVDPPDIRELRADIPQELKKIIERMLEKEPADRYQSASELRSDLEMVKLSTDSQVDLPGSPSSIINVLSTEKERIKRLEKRLASQNTLLMISLIAGIIGWLMVALLLLNG